MLRNLNDLNKTDNWDLRCGSAQPQLLEDNVTFQVSETGKRHRGSNVKFIIYAYESDDSSDIILNEMWNYKQHNQHTKMVSDSLLSWNSLIFPDDAKDIVLYEKLTCKIGVIFFLQVKLSLRYSFE